MHQLDYVGTLHWLKGQVFQKTGKKQEWAGEGKPVLKAAAHGNYSKGSF